MQIKATLLRIRNKVFNGLFLFIAAMPPIVLLLITQTVIIPEFQNEKNDTTGLTNSGFAIFAALSAVCFSWLRAIEPEGDVGLSSKVKSIGESSLHTAVIFIMASGLKFAVIHYKEIEIFKHTTYVNPLIINALYLSYTIAFLTAGLLAVFIIISLSRILWVRLKSNKAIFTP